MTGRDDLIAEAAEALTAGVTEIINRYRPGSASADQMTREIRALAENQVRAMLAVTDGPDRKTPRCAQCQRETDIEGRHLENGDVSCPRETPP